MTRFVRLAGELERACTGLDLVTRDRTRELPTDTAFNADRIESVSLAELPDLGIVIEALVPGGAYAWSFEPGPDGLHAADRWLAILTK